MSFLYQNKVLLSLIDSELKKEAQTARDDISALAKKLVNSLSNAFSDVASTNITSPTEAELKIDNLQNLGSLLKFLAGNQVALNGQRIAYTNDEQNEINEQDKDKLSPVSINVSRDNNTGKWNTADYYTNLSALVAYVKSLQQKASEMIQKGDAQGKILEVMTGKLADQVNQVKPDAGLERKPKSTPENPNQIADEEVLDGFGSKILDVKNPLKDRGSVLLKAKNIKSRTALNAWLQEAPEAQVIMYDAKGNPTKPLPYTDPQVDHCLVVNTLFARARYLQQLAKDEKQERNLAFYLKQVKEVGSTFAGLDGQACSVGTQTAPVAQSQTQTPKTDPMAVSKIVATLPLRVEILDFNRINQFFAEYTKLNPNVSQWSNPAQTYMQDALELMYPPMAAGKRIDLMAGPQQVLTWLKPPSGQNYLPFLAQLQNVLNMVGGALKDLKARYADTESGEAMITDPNQIARINGQIQGANSIWQQNYNTIDTLMSQATAVSPNTSRKR